MLPRLRTCHVTVVALVCAVVLAPARGGEPGTKQNMTRVYAVADLIAPISDGTGSPISEILPSPSCVCGSMVVGCALHSETAITATTPACCAAEPCCDAARHNCDFEFMCQQPGDQPCCTAGSCCQSASCCPNGACCPDGPCCSKSGCCAKAATNWTAIAAPEWCKAEAAKVQPQGALINLITSAVCPRNWSASGGSYTIDYMPTGKGLVVSAPPDVQEQVACLLESLHHLQDIQVAFDVKVVTVSDASFQQNFDAPSIAGGKPVFLTDREVRGMMDNFQGDPKCKVVCAPKLTVFNGQRASIRCAEDRFFVTNVNAVKFQDQPVFMPINSAFQLGYQMIVCPTVSADHKFVRCDLNAEHSELASAKVPLHPVTTFVTPVFEGGAQGQPIPFTQFIQQPNITRRNIQTSLTIPDGGTAMLYAGKSVKTDPAAEDESSAPLVDWIYDLVDLFCPPAEVPTVTEHLLVLVTPRVIVQHEEEMVQAQPMPMGPCQAATCCSAPVVKQCVAMADAPACPAQCAGPVCPSSSVWAVAPMPVEQQVQLDVCILAMDPAAWDSPLTASWADLSPKARDGKPNALTLTTEEAHRFCQSMKGQAGKILAEPRMVTLSGSPATFLSGGQMKCVSRLGIVERDGEIIPEMESTLVPFGTSLSLLPVISREGVRLQCSCELSVPNQDATYKVTIEAPGKKPRTDLVGRPVAIISKVQCVVEPPAGKTVVMLCGRNAEGQDVIVTVTPRIVEAPAGAAVLPTPVPTFRGQMGVEKAEALTVPQPLAHPCCTGTPSCMTNSLPACSTCPAPMPPPLVQVATTEPQGEPLLAKFMAKYRQACAVGDKAKAQAYADCCLAIDPTCFQK